MAKKSIKSSTDEIVTRKQQNQANMAKRRALESPDESVTRKQPNQAIWLH